MAHYDTRIRPPAVAGMFYDDRPDALAAWIDDALGAADCAVLAPKALIAPHAGYVYSGPIAASVYAQLASCRDTVTRVVLLGPNHRVPLSGVAASSATHFRTPLGDVPLDMAARDRVLRLPFVDIDDDAHALEHGLEVHLPFLQRTLNGFSIVPLVVGQSPPDDVARLLAELWGGPETLIVVSSDLSHYHPYDEARELDEAASRAVETLGVDRLEDGQACGRHPIRGLLSRARDLDLRPTTLDLRNSGDTAGDRSRVVGYGAWTFEYAESARLFDAHRASLKDIAREALLAAVGKGGAAEIALPAVPRPLKTARATFVSLALDGELRGCIGTLVPQEPLVADIVQNTVKAAFEDPRFNPVTREDAARVEIGISVLSTPRRLKFANEAELLDLLHPDRDGLLLVDGDRRAVFLPQVWDCAPDARDFLGRLKAKAGLPADYWSRSVEVYRFCAESF